MDSDQDLLLHYNNVVEALVNMFGEDIGRDVLFTVVENVDGDLNHAANIVMNIMHDNSNVLSNTDAVVHNIDNVNATEALTTEAIQRNTNMAPPPTYSARASINTGAIPRMPRQQTPTQNTSKQEYWSEQIKQIIAHHNQGSKILVLLRGVPGSGKSYLAKKIVDLIIGSSQADYNTHILSTDDYFTVRGVYNFDRSKLDFAHAWNKERAYVALKSGLSPVIIDNTNVELWEMEPYFKEGVQNGYIIEIMEPKTPWSKKAHILCKRNSHCVTYTTIKRMLDNFRSGYTVRDLFNAYNCRYPPGLSPPQIRNIPVFKKSEQQVTKLEQSPIAVVEKPNLLTSESKTIQTGLAIVGISTPHPSNLIFEPEVSSIEDKKEIENKKNNKENKIPEVEKDMEQQMRYLQIQQQIEEIQKLEQEWEAGETWDELKNPKAEATSNDYQSINQPKPSRAETKLYDGQCIASTSKALEEPSRAENNLDDGQGIASTSKALEANSDWSQISMFLLPWENKDPGTNEAQQTVVQKNTSSTCIEFGDTNIENLKPGIKMIIGKCRDINFYHIPNDNEKIPDVRMLDKSTMTKEDTLTKTARCKNEEKHFKAFRKLFKTVPKPALRDIFDKCCGDVNWAVEIVLDGNHQLKSNDESDLSDTEEVNDEECDCVAAYEIIPDIHSEQAVLLEGDTESSNTPKNILIQQQQKKTKKDSNTESSLQLKRQIEENVVISDSHYSQQCLKIRKMRRGETEEEGVDLSEPIFKDSEVPDKKVDTTPQFPPLTPVPSTSKEHTNTVDAIPSTSKEHTNTVDAKTSLVTSSPRKESAPANEEDSDNEGSEIIVPEKTEVIYLDKDLLSQIDEMFGRKDIIYPSDVVPKIKVPMSILNEINALWAETLTSQLDDQDKQTALMLKQDEEFARQLESMEHEMAKTGKEPAIPNFKEIMDMDLAISLYQKDVDEWKNNTPNDLAARLTREKLFNLFPDVSHDILTELLMAHDNNFQATVEVLLASTGKTEILESENGVNKFVAEKELEIKKQLLEAERKVLEEAEWPFLTRQDVVDMSTVQRYRDEAERHLVTRNLNYHKAQEYVRRGRTEVANYFSILANFHRKKYEHANSLAAASLMQVHAVNNPENTTIDLHYLRVNEAKEYLDLFLDTHIQKLKESEEKGGINSNTLFFITGRGLHSVDRRPRVKPAIKRRLKERGIPFTERNPGLLSAKVSTAHKLSYLVPAPA